MIISLKDKMGMTHLIEVDKTFLNSTRLEFIKNFVEGATVLHVGFVDWPKIRPNNSLHKNLSPYCKRLDGIDIRPAPETLTIENGKNFTSWSDIENIYDYIIIPEVLEHVDNVKDFFNILNKYDTKLIITTPDAYLLHHHFEVLENNLFKELVHPDHKCWYSPYTLQNTINSFSNKKVKRLYWNANHSICAVCE